MYTTTSKQQEGSTCKDSYRKCFIATKTTAKLWRGAMNRSEILRLCSHDAGTKNCRLIYCSHDTG